MKITTRLTASLIAIVLLMVVVDVVAVWPYSVIVSSNERTTALDQAALSVLRVNVNVYDFSNRLAAATGGETADTERTLQCQRPRRQRRWRSPQRSSSRLQPLCT